ncbi:MAG: glycosyltransferase family 39 protein [Anaerolineae bacterium]|nr:glycosyltransferase family 39 protein [Anaerolineae bacterium]
MMTLPATPPEDVSLPDAVSASVPTEAKSDVPIGHVDVEAMTVAELLGRFLRAPADTFREFASVVGTPEEKATPAAAFPRPSEVSYHLRRMGRLRLPVTTLTPEERAQRQRRGVQLGIWVAAVCIGLYGSAIMVAERTEAFGLNAGLPYLLVALMVWIAGEVYGSWEQIQARRRGVLSPPGNEQIASASEEQQPISLERRLIYGVAALAFIGLTLVLTAGNRFTIPGVLTWIGAVVLMVAAFAPAGWGLRVSIHNLRSRHLPRGGTLWVLLTIMVVAALFRFYDLSGVPAEMTSDHVEKILDSANITRGATQVFFPNNGGREPLHFYIMALFAQLPGLGFNFTTLKLLTAIEGLLTIPILWWLGRELIGEEDPELANWVGLGLAALVAVSYWHTMLARLGLRINLTVLFTALVVIYLVRGMRWNRRGDFIKAGLALGVGLYAYQAVRMLPVVIIAGIALAIVMRWFMRRSAQNGGVQFGKTLFHFAVLVILSGTVFVPMLGFALQYPNDFWRRTSGRLLGDDLIQTTDSAGNLVERASTLEERFAAFQQNVPVLLDNIRNALLMYNWKGDVAWVSAEPNRPTMDPVTGTLLIVGLGAWIARMVRRKDPADWLMPLLVFIMLLPSALSIAYPIENPSATRTSGTLPIVYLFAAVALGLVCLQIKRMFPDWRGRVGSVTLAVALVGIAGVNNWNTYFVGYREAYFSSSPAPYTEGGRVLRGFAESGGSFGNAYMIAYPYWWDHRALGLEAGLTDWPNGIVALDQAPSFLYLASLKSDQYRLDPDKDLLFFYSPEDSETEAALKVWFPTGYAQRIISSKPGDDFMIFRVPHLGTQGFADFVAAEM